MKQSWLRCGGEKKWTGGVWRIHVAKWKEEKKVEKMEKVEMKEERLQNTKEKFAKNLLPMM